MAAKSIGFRLTDQMVNVNNTNGKWLATYLNPEIMVGLSSKWMWHVAGVVSSVYQSNLKIEGVTTYLKYRFYANDEVHKHFRMALYGRASLMDHPVVYDEINLEMDNSGLGGGIVATQLLHKIALSASASYVHSMDNLGYKIPAGSGQNALDYTLSSGALLLPRVYSSYNQPNLNIFLELLGQSDLNTGKHFLDLAPALQLILSSRTRVDLSFRTQLAGDMYRFRQSVLGRLEYNIFNVYK